MGSGENVWPLAKSVTGEVGTSTGSRGDTGGGGVCVWLRAFQAVCDRGKGLPRPQHPQKVLLWQERGGGEGSALSGQAERTGSGGEPQRLPNTAAHSGRADSTGDYVVRVRIKRKLTQENTSRQGPAPVPLSPFPQARGAHRILNSHLSPQRWHGRTELVGKMRLWPGTPLVAA